MNLLGTQNKDISALQRRRYLPGLDRVCDAGYVTNKQLTIHLFTLYVLFSQFRPRDVLQGICLLSFH